MLFLIKYFQCHWLSPNKTLQNCTIKQKRNNYVEGKLFVALPRRRIQYKTAAPSLTVLHLEKIGQEEK